MCRLVEYKNGRVADIKLKYIENIARQAAKTRHITRIMLFGSALEERCREDSDVDIAVFGDIPRSGYFRLKEYKNFQDSIFDFDFDQDYDILYYQQDKEYKSAVMKDINKGVEIYRR
ncbi:MAG: nucleotidyltransferase domain-containing protein [Clostridia bacterium]|nr:nucleotidyltransferase domain-containing protein [Clostridia bacterium]